MLLFHVIETITLAYRSQVRLIRWLFTLSKSVVIAYAGHLCQWPSSSFGEDPVTQIADPLVIKDTGSVCRPWNHRLATSAELRPRLTHSVTHAPQSPRRVVEYEYHNFRTVTPPTTTTSVYFTRTHTQTTSLLTTTPLHTHTQHYPS